MSGDFQAGEWLVQPRLCRVTRAGTSVQVRARVMDLLVFLAAHPGEVVSKDDLLQGVWRTEAVSESALTSTIAELRHVLEQSGHPRVLETIPKRGYRLIIPIAAVTPPEHAPAANAEQPVRRAATRRRLVLTVVSALVICVLVGYAAFSTGPARPPVVAVLPFDGHALGNDNAHFAKHLHQEITLRLGMMSGLKVVERSAVLTYGGRRSDVAAVARDIGVDYVLLGTLSGEEGSIRFVPTLVDVRQPDDGWTEHYEFDRSLASLSAMQSAAALDIARALRVKISSAERGRVNGRITAHTAAYQLFLRSSEISDHPDALAASVRREELLKQAIELDPQFAAAIAALASTYASRSYSLGQRGDYADRAIQHAQKAIGIDPDLGEGYRALGLAYLDKGHLAASRAAFERLSELHPSDGHALLVLGWIDFLCGRIDRAVDQWMAARSLDPFNPTLFQNLAAAERLLGNDADAQRWMNNVEKLGGRPQGRVRALVREHKHAEALSVARHLLHTSPRSIALLEVAADAAIGQGDLTAAAAFLERLQGIAPDDWNFWGLTYRTQYAHVLQKMNRHADAVAVADRALQDAMQRIAAGDDRPGIRREMAALHAVRGDTPAALMWFERAINAGWRLEHLFPAPAFERLRGDANFERLLTRISALVAEADATIRRRGIRQFPT